MTATCESCGAEEPLTVVRRVYVTPESWESEHKAVPVAETEQWCVVCMSHYPHQRLD